MRFLLALALLFASSASSKSFPPLGAIDLYGNRTTSSSEIRKALTFQEGDTIHFDLFDAQKREAEQKLAEIPDVRRAFLTLVCCTEDRKSMLYVGIEEDASPCLQFLPEPTGTVQLSSEVSKASKEVADAWEKAVLNRDTTEDDSQGHAINSDPQLKTLQLALIPLAEAHLANLREVLRGSSDADQRAIAAQVLGYVKDKQAVVTDLVAAMRDPSSEVRNNAMRALMVFTKYTPKPPAKKIQVPSEPFLEMLNSCIWTDRNKSSAAVEELTESHDPALLTELREHALVSLIEMARWKSMLHASTSLTILGRMGGLTEGEILTAEDSGNREAIIATAQKTAARQN